MILSPVLLISCSILIIGSSSLPLQRQLSSQNNQTPKSIKEPLRRPKEQEKEEQSLENPGSVLDILSSPNFLAKLRHYQPESKEEVVEFSKMLETLMAGLNQMNSLNRRNDEDSMEETPFDRIGDFLFGLYRRNMRALQKFRAKEQENN